MEEIPKDTENDFLPARGYFQKGDKGENVKKINDFYCSEFVKGVLFGDNTEVLTKEFQRKMGLEVDGRIGPATLSKLAEIGFKY